MKLQDLDAGESFAAERAGSLSRRRLLQGMLAGAAVTLTSPVLAQGKVLLPGQIHAGSRVVQRPNEAGFPDARNGGIGPMTLFVFPVAVAVTPTREIYIADAGHSALFRLDPMTDTMTMVRGLRITQQTRLAAANDGSVMVASGGALPVVRIGRSGRVIQGVEAQIGTTYDEVVVDQASGRFYGLDKVQRRLEEVMPHGRGAVVLPDGLVPDQPTAMAMDGQKIYIAGRVCQCLAAIDVFGNRSLDIFAEDVGQAVALAAADGWLAVADGRERLVKVWRQGALLAEADYQSLGLLDPRGMSIAQQTLYIADGAGRRILTFRLRH